MIKITCTSCRKPLSIDETKLPNKEVAFPCPACKTKLTVDRRTLNPEAALEPSVGAHAGEPADDDDFSERAIIVGIDHPGVRQAAKSLGFSATYLPTAEAARDFYTREYPPVVFLVPAQVSTPPLTEMTALTSVSPSDRRKGFFILVADNLKTLDGNAAFLYNVNLVVATKDLGSINQIYKEASTFQKRLYGSFDEFVSSGL